MSDSPRNSHHPHTASATEAANGEGTIQRLPRGDILDRPVLDGSTEHYDDEQIEDPRRGMEDPALIRHPEEDHENVETP